MNEDAHCTCGGELHACHPFSSDAGEYFVCDDCGATYEPYEVEEIQEDITEEARPMTEPENYEGSGCPDCTDGKGDGPRCSPHKKEYLLYEIRCNLNCLEEIFRKERND